MGVQVSFNGPAIGLTLRPFPQERIAMPVRIALVNDHRWIDPVDPDDYAGRILTEDGLVVDALTRRGAAVERVAWSDPEVDWAGFDIALIRQTWDYFERYPEFLDWLGRAEALTRIVNPAALIRWNADKRYMLELERAGVPIVPTLLFARGSAPGLLVDHLAAAGWAGAVIKPSVSGGGRETWRIDGSDPDAQQAHWQRLVAAEDMLLQPFLPEILDRGELSLIVIDGQATHAVRKRAAPGEFRVQDDHGGTVAPAEIDDEAAAVAEQAVAASPIVPLYARVDLVETGRGPLLMELELIEPELFYRFCPAAAERLAEALLRRD